MKVLVINGNPKQRGFISGSLDIVSARLVSREVEVDSLRLADLRIEDCTGCFHCLKAGKCVLDDDMAGVIERMVEADGFVVGSPVRNGLMTALYKRFYERITYPLGFPLLLEDKHTLAISCVGMMGGKKVNKRLLGLQDVFHTHLSGFVFCSVGIPTKLQPEDIRPRLERAADKLLSDIESRRPKPLLRRLSAAIDRVALRNLMFKKSPETYSYVIDCWKEKGYM